MTAADATAPAYAGDLAGAVASNTLWYHTMELAPGVVTPGWFDLRPVVDRMPWPEVRGKRCLDIGTYDGFLAFELERRGAAEVVCTDVDDHRAWDWPPDARTTGPEVLAGYGGPERGRGFEIARQAFGSSAQRRRISIYDLDPSAIGRFDVVVCGSLLLHLRDPVRALEAARSVCAGVFLSAEEIRLGLTLRHPRRPVAELNGSGILCQWWVPNAAGHRRMLYAAGFEIERRSRPYSIPFGPAHPRTGWSGLPALAVRRLSTGHAGVPTAAVLARPRL